MATGMPVTTMMTRAMPAIPADLQGRVTVVATGLGQAAEAEAEPPMRVVRRPAQGREPNYADLDKPTVQRKRAVGDGVVGHDVVLPAQCVLAGTRTGSVTGAGSVSGSVRHPAVFDPVGQPVRVLGQVQLGRQEQPALTDAQHFVG